MEKAIKVRGRCPLFPFVVLWRSSRLQPQKAGRFCSERFHRLLVFGLLWIPWIALYSPGAKGVGVRLGVCPTPTSFLGECDLCSARTEVSVLETLSSVNEWDEESPATTTRFDHSPRGRRRLLPDGLQHLESWNLSIPLDLFEINLLEICSFGRRWFAIQNLSFVK